MGGRAPRRARRCGSGPGGRDRLSGGVPLTGQACTATSRVLVVGNLYDDVVREVIARARGFKIGNGLDPGVTMGPLANEVQYTKVRK